MTEEKKQLSKLKSVKGMKDILPDEHAYYTIVKKAVRHRCRQAGYKRITTPILEDVRVFERGIGKATDVVEKEMYTLETQSRKESKKKILALKPESTAGVVRAYIQNGMSSWSQPVQLYYIEPHFRHDNPQKGRYRQFWQYGIEVIGSRDPSVDAQVILLAQKILKDLKIADRFELQINTIGTPECRKKYEEALQNHFIGKERNLCEDCQRRVAKNPLRILDCKKEDCQILASLAPKFDNFLDEESKEFYKKVLDLLDELEIKYIENKKLVRGLDYYCDIVFEFWDKEQGSKNAIGGGGRYDGLCEMLGGEPTPGIGFAFGIERIIAHLKETEIKPPNKDKLHIFVTCLGDLAKQKAIKIISDLQDAGIHTLGSLGKASMRAQLRMANKFEADWTIILGEIEVLDNVAIIRNMTESSQINVPLNEIVERMIEKIGKENLDRYSLGE